jgi:hypothetical protein
MRKSWSVRVRPPNAIRRLVVTVAMIAAGLSASSRPALAQAKVNASCAAATVTFQDACQKAVDVFDYMVPQLSTAIAGGNATLGQSGTLGGLPGGPPHVTLGFRANGVYGSFPKVNNVTIATTGAASSTFQTSTIPVPMVMLEGGVGVFNGVTLGMTRVLSADLLINAIYVPSVSASNISIHPVKSLNANYGARLGLIGEAGPLPSLSWTYTERDFPITTVTGVSNGDSLQVDSIHLKTSGWRFVVGKHFMFLGLAGGYGQDRYRSATTIRAEVAGTPSGTTPLVKPGVAMTRTIVFADLSLNAPFFSFAAEIGQASGGTLLTYNAFAGKQADASRPFASAGFRIKI